MVVVCGEIEGNKKGEEEEDDDNIETEAADEKHRKPRYVCGEEIEREEKYDLFLYSSNAGFSTICYGLLTY
jgi:hypothetical protein